MLTHSSDGIAPGGPDRPGFPNGSKTSKTRYKSVRGTWHQKDASGFRNGVQWGTTSTVDAVSSSTSGGLPTKGRCATPVPPSGTCRSTENTAILGTDTQLFWAWTLDILGTDTIFWARTSVILGTDISLRSCMLSLTKEIQTMSLTHDRRRKWRKKNKARDTKWRKGRSTCEFCGTSYQNCKRATHMKRKSCRKARGLKVSPRKTRSDKKKK